MSGEFIEIDEMLKDPRLYADTWVSRYLSAPRRHRRGKLLVGDVCFTPDRGEDPVRHVAESKSAEDFIYWTAASLWNYDFATEAVDLFDFLATSGHKRAQLANTLNRLWLHPENVDAAVAALEEMAAEASEVGDEAAGHLALDLIVQNAPASPRLLGLLERGYLRDEGAFEVDLGSTALQLGDVGRAQEVLTRAVRRGNSDAPIVLGNILWDEREHRGRAALAYLIGIRRGDAYSAHNLGQLLRSFHLSWPARWLTKYAAKHGDEMAEAWLDTDRERTRSSLPDKTA